MTRSHRDKSLDELLAECAERVEAEGPAALEALCRAHPQHAESLRAGVRRLARYGVVGVGSRQPAEEYPRLADFRIEGELGRGSMGVVYDAWQVSLARPVALKVLSPAWLLDDRQVLRFENEARITAALDHPNVVSVFSVGCENGLHYYAMQRIDGITVRDLIRGLRVGADDAHVADTLRRLRASPSCGSTSTSSAVWFRAVADLGRQAADALDAAHQVGVVHRDIKPANLMIDADGRLLVTDFGLALVGREGTALTRSGEFVGTLVYSSPEQAAGRRSSIERRSDVYALGATLYEILTLRPPFATSDRADLFRRIATEEPPRPRRLAPQVPRDLETIVLKAMAKEPGRRYQTAADLREDLCAFADGRPIRARRVGWPGRVALFCRRNPALALTSGALVTVLAIAGLVGRFAVEAAEQRNRAVLAERRLRVATGLTSAWAELAGEFSGRRARAWANLQAAAHQLQRSPLDVDRETARALRLELRSAAIACLSTFDVEATSEPLPDGLTLEARSRTQRLTAQATQGSGIRLVDRDSGCSFELAPGSPRRMWFDETGRWLAVTWAAEAAVFDVERRAAVWRSRAWGQLGFDQPFAFDPTGDRILLVGRSDELDEVDLTTGAARSIGHVTRPEGVGSKVREMWVSPDGSCLAIQWWDGVSVHARDGGLTAVLPADERTVCLTWCQPGLLCLGGSDGVIRMWRTATGVLSEVGLGHGADIVTLAFDECSELLLSRGWDQTLRLWRLGDVTPLIAVRGGAAAHPVMHEGQFGPVHDFEHQQTRTYRIADRFYREYPQFPRGSVEPAFGVDLDRGVVVVATSEGILLRALGSGRAISHVELPGQARSFVFRSDGLLCAHDGGLSRIDLRRSPAGAVQTGAVERLMSASGRHEATSVPGRDAVLVARAGRLLILDPASGKVTTLEASGDSHSIDLRVSPDGRRAALGSWGGSGALWDLSTGKILTRLPKGRCRPCFDASGRLWLCEVGRVRAFAGDDLGTAVVDREVPLAGGRPGMIGFSRRGGLAAWTRDDELLLCRAADVAPIARLTARTRAQLFQPCFSTDGTLLMAASLRQGVATWVLDEIEQALEDLGLGLD